MTLKKIGRVVFIVLCISIGLYPYSYFILERTFGLLASKPAELLQDMLWNIMFYTHILLGGFALMIGWSQFCEKWRLKYLKLHRRIGIAYVISAVLSGSSGLYIAFFATGGWVSVLGFASLASVWLFTTIKAFVAIKNGRIIEHQKLMVLSYAVCFAAVTLRIWLPLLSATFGSFIPAYRIVAWLCWVPNLLVALYLIRNIDHNKNGVVYH